MFGTIVTDMYGHGANSTFLLGLLNVDLSFAIQEAALLKPEAVPPAAIPLVNTN